jgi:hypothetical protein
MPRERRKGKESKGRKGKERKGKEREGKERKGKERKGKEREQGGRKNHTLVIPFKAVVVILLSGYQHVAHPPRVSNLKKKNYKNTKESSEIQKK